MTFATAGVPVPIAAKEHRKRRRPPLLLSFSIAWLVVLGLAALLADVLPLSDFAERVGAPRVPPFTDPQQILGTDEIGRSQLSRVIYGARASLMIGIGAVALGIVIGGLIGMLAGYFRGWFDRVVAVITDSLLAFPPLILLIAISATLGAALQNLIIGLTVLITPTFARLARATTLTFARREFVTASTMLGARHPRIVFRSLVPNVALPIVAYAFVVLAVVIVAEGSLSFLGLGVQPPTPSWGGMISTGRASLATDPWLVFVPAGTMLLTIFAFNVVGDWARDRFDVRSASI